MKKLKQLPWRLCIGFLCIIGIAFLTAAGYKDVDVYFYNLLFRATKLYTLGSLDAIALRIYTVDLCDDDIANVVTIPQIKQATDEYKTETEIASQIEAYSYFKKDGSENLSGIFVFDIENIAADDTTPDISAGSVFRTGANTQATEITAFEGMVAGQMIELIGNADETYASTMSDSGEFNLSANWTAYNLYTIGLIYASDTEGWTELSRSNN